MNNRIQSAPVDESDAIDQRYALLREIELTRRSVQSYVEFRIFPLDESGSPSAVNNTFLSFGIRDKKPQE